MPLPTWSLAEGQRNQRLRLVRACHSAQQCCMRSSWKTLTLGQYWNGRSWTRDPLVLKYVPQALLPGTVGIAGPYYRYKMACWWAILLDMMQWVITCSSLCPGLYVMKFCTMFMTHYLVDTWAKRKPERQPSKGSTGVVLERIAIIRLLNVMNVPM